MVSFWKWCIQPHTLKLDSCSFQNSIFVPSLALRSVISFLNRTYESFRLIYFGLELWLLSLLFVRKWPGKIIHQLFRIKIMNGHLKWISVGLSLCPTKATCLPCASFPTTGRSQLNNQIQHAELIEERCYKNTRYCYYGHFPRPWASPPTSSQFTMTWPAWPLPSGHASDSNAFGAPKWFPCVEVTWVTESILQGNSFPEQASLEGKRHITKMAEPF